MPKTKDEDIYPLGLISWYCFVVRATNPSYNQSRSEITFLVSVCDIDCCCPVILIFYEDGCVTEIWYMEKEYALWGLSVRWVSYIATALWGLWLHMTMAWLPYCLHSVTMYVNAKPSNALNVISIFKTKPTYVSHVFNSNVFFFHWNTQ